MLLLSTIRKQYRTLPYSVGEAGPCPGRRRPRVPSDSFAPPGLIADDGGFDHRMYINGGVCLCNLIFHLGCNSSGVRVASINVGGLTYGEASSYLAGYLEQITDKPVTIVYGSMQWDVVPSQIGVDRSRVF